MLTRYERIVCLLVEAGASVNVQDKKYGESPLHHAAGLSSLDATKYLLDNGADITCRTIFGQTVLHEAAGSASAEVITELLERY